MRRWFFLAFVFFCFSASAQKDTAFQKRLDQYMALTRALDFDKLVNYIHPKIFKMVSKAQLAEVLKSAYENDDMNITLDSVNVTKFSPSYNFQGSLYRKIDYYIALTLKFNDSTV